MEKDGEANEDWSVVGKKEKKSSPKAPKKNLKRGEPPVQRSISSGQLNDNTRRRRTSPSNVETNIGITTRSGANLVKVTPVKSSTNTPFVAEDELEAGSPDTFSHIIEDVSRGIKKLSIGSIPSRMYASSYSAVGMRNIQTQSMSVHAFCTLCRSFNALSSSGDIARTLQTRCEIYTA
jgi:hypothetical protein